MTDAIAVLDFGSQYAQLITRRVREAHVYCELVPWNASPEKVLSLKPKGFILSGGPASVYDPGAPTIPAYILESHLPILGICYGMQALTHALGGEVYPATSREYGYAEIEPLTIPAYAAPASALISSLSKVWMSHGDKITRMPEGFIALARSGGGSQAGAGIVEAHRPGTAGPRPRVERSLPSRLRPGIRTAPPKSEPRDKILR